MQPAIYSSKHSSHLMYTYWAILSPVTKNGRGLVLTASNVGPCRTRWVPLLLPTRKDAREVCAEFNCEIAPTGRVAPRFIEDKYVVVKMALETD